MSKLPSKEDFEITLGFIAERDKGTPELREEAEKVEPTEDSVRTFTYMQAELIIQKIKAVQKSPVPKWLLTQHKYQEALKWVTRHSKRLPKIDHWAANRTKTLLEVYEPVDFKWFKFNISDPECYPEEENEKWFEDYNSIANRKKRFSRAVVQHLQGFKSWDTAYINAIYDFIYGNMQSETSVTKETGYAKEIECTEHLISFFTEINSTHPFLASDDEKEQYIKTLSSIKNNFDFFSATVTESDYHSRGGDTLPIRKLAHILWQWFQRHGDKNISGEKLHQLLQIDGIADHLIEPRRFEDQVRRWRRIDS